MGKWIGTEVAIQRMVDVMPTVAGLRDELSGSWHHSAVNTTSRLSKIDCRG